MKQKQKKKILSWIRDGRREEKGGVLLATKGLTKICYFLALHIHFISALYLFICTLIFTPKLHFITKDNQGYSYAKGRTKQRRINQNQTMLFHGYLVFISTFVLNFVGFGQFNASSLYINPLQESFPDSGSGTLALFCNLNKLGTSLPVDRLYVVPVIGFLTRKKAFG